MKRKYGFVAALLCVLLVAGMGLTTLYVRSEEQKEGDGADGGHLLLSDVYRFNECYWRYGGRIPAESQ